MSRSLGKNAIRKKAMQAKGLDAEGRKMFADGLPCPPEMKDRGKAHALAKGWRRAAAEARQPKSRQRAQQREGQPAPKEAP